MINLPLNIDYSGKVVVITGAGGLICGAMARAFAQSGARVAALDLNEEAVKKLAEKGCDRLNGARSLRRLITSEIEDMLAQKLLDMREDMHQSVLKKDAALNV